MSFKVEHSSNESGYSDTSIGLRTLDEPVIVSHSLPPTEDQVLIATSASTAEWKDLPLSGPFADFYAIMPSDNASTVALGGSVEFPQDGLSLGSDITRLSASTFNLAAIGLYEVQFQVSITEAGQLVVFLGAVAQPTTVVGRATGTSQIVGVCVVQTTVINTVLSIRNPAGNAAALTVTSTAGGTESVSAHLLIKRLV